MISTSTIRNTCPIIQLTVQPYQRQNNNTITWYPIKIELYTNQCFEIKYRYSDFIQFARNIHHQYSILKNNLPVIKKESYYYNFLKKGNQKYIDRQSELENFCKGLLSLPAIVTCSDLFISFFSEKQRQIPRSSSKSTLKRVFSFKPTNNKYDLTDIGLSQINTVSVSPSKLQKHHQSMVSSITIGGSSGRSSATSSTLFSPSLSSDLVTEDTIKLKIIYDWNNIVIIRVPRSVSLDQIRSQVIQKFALLNIQLPDQLVLLSNNGNKRYSSASSITCSDSLENPGVATLISEEEHLSNAMQTKWSCFQKVTLCCLL